MTYVETRSRTQNKSTTRPGLPNSAIWMLRLVELGTIGPILKVHYIFILTQAAIRKATHLDLSCNILTSLPVSTPLQ